MPASALAVDGSVAAAIGWFYLVTNSARVLSYIPQIVVVWRCRDGARAISLITWGSWLVSHLAAVAYGALVVHDAFFCAISAINFAGCATVTALTVRRRGWMGGRPPPPLPAAVAPKMKSNAPTPCEPRCRRPRSFAALPRTRESGNPRASSKGACPADRNEASAADAVHAGSEASPGCGPACASLHPVRSGR